MVHSERRGLMRLLMVASDPMEFPGLTARATEVRPLRLGINWARSARLGAHEVTLAANGAGWRRAAAAVDAACRHSRPDAVLNVGFCGALDDGLRHYDIVMATGIAAPGRNYAAKALSGSTAHSGIVCSADHVIQTADEKRRLRQSGAIAVEMEAAGVAERTEELGIPFSCIRIVTDTAGENMANDFNAALRSDGHFATMIILRGALRQPMVRFPELIRLRNRCSRASRILGDFIVDCRF
jgi:adenosylhomocysteine nucleosidase